MGDPAVPDVDAQHEALELAERILDAIRNDQPVTEVVLGRYGGTAAELRATMERALWLLAATLIYLVEPDAE
jgi:hypothetical protein